MTELENFTWHGENGEPLKFADLPPYEQRIALIAAGGLLRNPRLARPANEGAETAGEDK